MSFLRLVGILTAIGILLGCGPVPKQVAQKNPVPKKDAAPKNSARTTSKKAPKPLPTEDNSTPAVDFTPPGLRPGSQPLAEPTPPPMKPSTTSKASGRLPAGKVRRSASGAFEFWMPNGASASDSFDFRSGDIQSKGLQWFSRDMETMLGFAEVRLDGPATKEILKQTAEQSSAGEDPKFPWVAITFCGCEALERKEVLDFGEGKSHTREVIFIDGDSIYQLEGLEPGDKPVSEIVNKLFTSCQRVAGAKTPAPRGHGDYVRSPASGEYEIWMPRKPLRLDPGQIEYKDRQGECWMGSTTDTDLTFYLAECDVGEPATLAIAHAVAKKYWSTTRGVSTREVRYAGLEAVEQTYIGDDELQVRYFVVAGNRIYLVAWIGTDKQGNLPDVTKFLASFRKAGADSAPSAMQDIPGGPVTKRAPADE